MNALAKVSITVMVLILGSRGQSEQAAFSLIITANSDSVREGSIVNIQVAIANHSNRTVSVHEGGVLEDWALDVRGFDGRAVPDTELARKVKAATKGTHQRNFIVRLKPGESRKDTIEVSTFCDMSQPGEYTTRVQHQLPPELARDRYSPTGLAPKNETTG